MAGLLDGDLRDVFGSVFAPLLLDAVITKVTLIPDGAGGISEVPQDAPARGMVEKYSAYERAQGNIPTTDVKLIVLQKDVALVPDLDSRITIRGQLYSIQAIEQDPAQASWTIQGRPIHQQSGPSAINVTAPVIGRGDAGRPALRLIVTSPVTGLSGVGTPDIGQGAEIGVGAGPVGLGTVGVPALRLVISDAIAARADAGTARVAVPAYGAALGIAAVGQPLHRVIVTAPVSGQAGVGAPEVDTNEPELIEITAPASGIAATGTATLRAHIDGPAAAVADAGAAQARRSVTGDVAAQASVGAPQVSVPVSGQIDGSGRALPPAVRVPVEATAAAIADTGAPAQRVPIIGTASGVADLRGPEVRVPVAAAVSGIGSAPGVPDVDEAPTGPGFDAFTIHAWDPDGGSNGSGIVPDAVGSISMHARRGASALTSWDGQFTDYQHLVLGATDAAAALTGADRTITFWMRRETGSGNYITPVNYATQPPDDGGERGGWILFYGDGGFMAFSVRVEFDFGGGGNIPDFPTDAWTFNAITLGGSDWAWYLDGEEVADVRWNPGANLDVGRVLKFGPSLPGAYTSHTDTFPTSGNTMVGRFGDIRVHNKILNSTEIGDLYSAGRQSY